MSARPIAAVILAAGAATRMNSGLPKVLHPVAGLPMIQHVLRALAPLRPARMAVVTAPDQQAVRAASAPAAEAVQDRPLGTAHAVLAAREHLAGFDGVILVLFGDTPLLTDGTLRALAEAMSASESASADPAVAVLGFRPEDATGYGRLITEGDGRLQAIVEDRDCTEAQRRIGLCNGGVMALDGRVALALLARIGNDNAKGEYYLTDIVALARAENRACVIVEAVAEEVMGVDDRARLALAEAVAQRRLRRAALAAGVTLIAPETVWFSHDTAIGRDSVIEPHVVFGPGVSIGENVHVRGFSHLQGCTVDAGAVIGPHARLRPGAEIGAGARVGNFVEIKAAQIEQGAKVNHLTYIGDARIGAEANIGAGTITCNYDGFAKHRTEIGAKAFIGSNSALVAPVSIGEGAIVAAGSTIDRNVPPDQLALTRAPQTGKDGWAARFRRVHSKKKAKKQD